MNWKAVVLLTLGLCTQACVNVAYVKVPGGVFRSALPEKESATVTVPPFELRALPVTNAEFLAFVRANPQWQRGRVKSLFAGPRYLAGWQSPVNLGRLSPAAPVTNISWYAARAFCSTEHARLPTWYEWEFSAAADAHRPDARADPAWREKILAWYEHPSSDAMPATGQGAPNYYGIYDVHASIFEWVDDFNGLFVSTDTRSQGEENNLATCGAGALSLDDRENYAVLMRIALLSALNASDTVPSLGFRCARDADSDQQPPPAPKDK